MVDSEVWKLVPSVLIATVTMVVSRIVMIAPESTTRASGRSAGSNPWSAPVGVACAVVIFGPLRTVSSRPYTVSAFRTVYLQVDTLYEYHGNVVGSRSDRECGQPIWARTKDAPRPALSRASIVAAAIAIADAEGIDAVSIRRVAAELGTRAMSLYTYIARKEDLLDLMSDEINAELLIEGELPAHWRRAVSQVSRRYPPTLLPPPGAG